MNKANSKLPVIGRVNTFRRCGFTLVELMVVIVIIGVLASLVVGAIRGAQLDTYAAKTRATIAKIDAVLNERTEEYMTRNLKFTTPTLIPPGTDYVEQFPRDTSRPGTPPNPETVFRKTDTNWPADAFGRQLPPIGLLRERVRLAATRDLMRLEMPDRIGDLYFFNTMTNTNVYKPPVILDTGFVMGAGTNLFMQLEPPAEFFRITQRLEQIGPIASREYLNEELLYLIVEGSFVDGESAIEAFGPSEISDRDGDGLHEFIDAWGNPIRWIRWPAGFETVSPLNPDPLDPVYAASGGSANDPLDPTNSDVGFDPANLAAGLPIHRTGNGLRPLIVSAGPDQEFGIRFYWRQDYLLPSSATFTRAPLFSPSNVQWPISTNVFSSANGVPTGPSYFSAGFNWPDPYHPRFDLTTYAPESYRLGGIMTCAVDFLNNSNEGEIVGVDMTTAPPSFVFKNIYQKRLSSGANATAIDNAFQEYASNNVTNLDESGATP